MTLLELVVALTITGAALAAGYGAFATIVDQRARLTAATDSVARAAAIRRTVSDWLRGARVGAGGPEGLVVTDFRGLDGASGVSSDDEISFLTDARTPLGDMQALVRLYIDRDPQTAERGLTAALTDPRGAGVRRFELAPEIGGLDARYRSTFVGGGRWLPSWITRTLLPDGIEIRFEPEAGAVLAPLLTLPLTVPTGSRV